MMEMKHYISACAERGNRCAAAGKVELEEAMRYLSLPEMAGAEKSDCVLIFNGYNDSEERYSRHENELNRFSTIFVDVDNPGHNPDLLNDFKRTMEGYDYWLYETYSSTPEVPKFRAIIPMDEELEWNRYAKTAIFRIFARFADDHASWFYSPTLNRLDTITHHETGRFFPARLVKAKADQLADDGQMEMTRRFLAQARMMMNNKDGFNHQRPEGWRHLPTVKYCLGGLTKGERDVSISKACYAMKKLGYAEHIHEFIDELNVPAEFKNKFHAKYR